MLYERDENVEDVVGWIGDTPVRYVSGIAANCAQLMFWGSLIGGDTDV